MKFFRFRTALSLPAIVALLFIGNPSLTISSRAAGFYDEPFRPLFHFSPAKDWMNDPNGLVFYDGEYHLFYQHNPFGDKWGHMSWGHAVSRDLVHWEHLPLALAEENGVMIFSGSAVVDWKNTSGFGQNGQPPMVAIYTGHYTSKPLQNQNIAYSNDRGRTWTKFSGNPVLDIGARDFRDPKVSWHEPTKRWVMTVAWPAQRMVRFYASPNLKAWTHLSDFGPAGSTSGVWECPDLFPLPVGQKTKWVLIVNVSSDAPAGGSGCQYFVGDFDGTQFTPDPALPAGKAPLWADFGPDFYAAVSWSDIPQQDGRRLWLGWMSNWTYANDVPTSAWRNAMSIPRELSLRQIADGLRLLQKPVREMEKLRGAHYEFKGGSIAEANGWLKANSLHGNSLEIVVEFLPPGKGSQGLKLLQGPEEETVVGVDRDHGRIYLDRKRSGNVTFHPKFSGQHVAPLSAPGNRVRLHIFIDACSVEVFANNGEQVLTDLVFPSPGSDGLEFFAPTENARILAVDIWPLKSSWISEPILKNN